MSIPPTLPQQKYHISKDCVMIRTFYFSKKSSKPLNSANPLKILTPVYHKLTTALLESVEGRMSDRRKYFLLNLQVVARLGKKGKGRMFIEKTSPSISMKVMWQSCDSNLQTLDLQSDALQYILWSLSSV